MRKDYRAMLKNVSDSTVVLTEMGDYELQPGEEVDANDRSRTGQHWPSHLDVDRAINDIPGTQISQLVASGIIEYRTSMMPGMILP